MDKIISKHYDGFEGEPEIQFVRIAKNGERFILRIWIGFFDSIMDMIEPQKSGWTGLAYYYHMYEGWYDESPWQIADVQAVIDELKEINSSVLDNQTQNVLKDIFELLQSVTANETVWINYD